MTHSEGAQQVSMCGTGGLQRRRISSKRSLGSMTHPDAPAAADHHVRRLPRNRLRSARVSRTVMTAASKRNRPAERTAAVREMPSAECPAPKACSPRNGGGMSDISKEASEEASEVRESPL